MGAKEMVAEIKEAANEEGARILEEAKANADQKLEASKAELEAQKQQFIAAEERKGVEEKERIVRAARQDARKLRWTAEEEMIAKTLAAALERIEGVKSGGFKDSSYPEILAGLIKESALSIAAGSSAGADVEVLLSEEDATASYVDQAMLTQLADEISSEKGATVQLSLADERIKSAGGVIVRRKDGTIEVNNTFEQRMARLSTNLREEIVKTLFTGK
jgi:V/A-type H+-transporting ATPase subunit E